MLDTPRLRLALARGDLASPSGSWRAAPRPRLAPRLAAPLRALGGLDALAALRPPGVRGLATPRRGTYLEPFLLRALGPVREDEALLAGAAAGFDALRLETHAAETRALLQGGAPR